MAQSVLPPGIAQNLAQKQGVVVWRQVYASSGKLVKIEIGSLDPESDRVSYEVFWVASPKPTYRCRSEDKKYFRSALAGLPSHEKDGICFFDGAPKDEIGKCSTFASTAEMLREETTSWFLRFYFHGTSSTESDTADLGVFRTTEVHWENLLENGQVVGSRKKQFSDASYKLFA
jgi:hypothetical protein